MFNYQITNEIEIIKAYHLVRQTLFTHSDLQSSNCCLFENSNEMFYIGHCRNVRALGRVSYID